MFKSTAFLFFTSLMICNSSFGQWKKIYTGFNNDLYDVQTINKHAFACGQSSKVVYSADSGKSWKSLSLTIPANLRCLYFWDSLKGVVCGENARIQKTSDGGKTWTQKYVRTAAFSYDITFKGPIGLAVGKDMLVIASSNEGESWSLDTTFSIRKQLNSVAISNNGECWAVGDSGIIIHKKINQNKWSIIPSGTKINLNHVSCFNDSIILACGGMPDTAQVGVHYNVFLISRDTGKTWQSSIIPEMKTIFSASFITPDTGWMVGSNGIICKVYHPLYSRGQQLSGTANALNSVSHLSGYGLAVGDGGTILRTDNFGGFGLSANSIKQSRISIHPNPGSGYCHILSNDYIEKVEFISATGQLFTLEVVDQTIDISFLPAGIYQIRIQVNSEIFTSKFVKH